MTRLSSAYIAFVFALACAFCSFPCRAAGIPQPSASAYILMDADSGRILLSSHETDELAIASTTKIMTALVALRHASLSDSVTVRREHLKEGSSMYLTEGETLTMEDLLYGLMLPSGNDAAECIADVCGGGVEQFVSWMNETAQQLGMEHTSFANPSGLDADGHYSCALDMAQLMAAAMRDPTFCRIVSSRTASAGQRFMSNHNKLLGAVAGCIGGKTGYTGAAGRTLVTCAERDGLRLIAVTLRDGNDWQDHEKLYDYGFSAYHGTCALEKNACCALISVSGGDWVCTELTAAESYYYPITEAETLSLHMETEKAAQAPVSAGQQLGEAIILCDGVEVGRVSLLAARTIRAVEVRKKPNLSELFQSMIHPKK